MSMQRQNKISKEPCDHLLDSLIFVSKFYKREVSREMALSGLPVENVLTPSLFHRAAEKAEMTSSIYHLTLDEINISLLPAILLLKGESACVLLELNPSEGNAVVFFPELKESVSTVPLNELEDMYLGTVIYCRAKSTYDTRLPSVMNQDSSHWLWDVIKENSVLYRDVLIASIVMNVFSVAMPLFVMNIYDRVVPNLAFDTLWVLSVGVFIVISLELFLKIVRSKFVDAGAMRVNVKVSAEIMAKVLSMKIMDKPKSLGAYVSQLQSFESIKNILSSAGITSLVDVPFAVLFAIIIAIIQPILVIPIVIGIGLIVLYSLITQSKIERMSDETLKLNALRNSILYESIANIESVKAMRAESKVQLAWEGLTQSISETGDKSKQTLNSLTGLIQWIHHTVNITIIIIGVYLISVNELSMGGLVAVYLLSSRIVTPLSGLAGLLSLIKQAKTSLAVLDDIMSKPSERPQHKKWIRPREFKGVIEFKNVCFKFPDSKEYVLRDVSFKVSAGEHVALLGTNGSGKSTLIKLLMGFYEPESGSILLDGYDIYSIDPVVLRKYMGYVSQDLSLFYGSIKDNISVPENGVDDSAIIKASRISGLLSFVNHIPGGFDFQVGEAGQRLSQGQKQLVNLTRALLNAPPVLLLDEPTSNLDNIAESKVVNNLIQSAQAQTMLVVTHKESFLKTVSRILVLDKGKLVADGQKDDVLNALRSGQIKGGQR